MDTITEAQMALIIVLMIILILMLFSVAVMIAKMIRVNRDHHFKMNVIIDNLIEIVATKYYGKDREENE